TVTLQQTFSQVQFLWPETKKDYQVLLPYLYQTIDPNDLGIYDQDDFGNTGYPDPTWFVYAWTTSTNQWTMTWWTLPFGLPLSTATPTTSATEAVEASVSLGRQSTVETAPIILTTEPIRTSVSSDRQPNINTRPNASKQGISSHEFAPGETTLDNAGKSSASPIGSSGTLAPPEEQRTAEKAVGHSNTNTGEQSTSSPLSRDPTLLSGSSSLTRAPQNTTLLTTREESGRTIAIETDHTTYSFSAINPGSKVPFSPPDSKLQPPTDARTETSHFSHPSLNTTMITLFKELPPISFTKAADNPPGPISPGSAARFANLHTEADFFMVSLVPVLLTTILAILTQVLTSNISSMLPFRGLSYGVDTRDTLLLPRSPSIFSTSGINIRFLTHYRDPLPLLNTLLSTLSTILVPISSEAIRLEISTTCSSKSKSPPLTEWEKLPTVHCAFGLRRSIITVRVTEATLVIMTLLIVVLCYMLLRWKTGVEAEPWSIASMAGLLSSSAPKLQAAIQSTSSCLDKRRHSMGMEIRDVTSEDTKWRIGYYHSPDPPGQHQVKPASGANNRHYGIHAMSAGEDDSPIRLTVRNPLDRTAITTPPSSSNRHRFLRNRRFPNSIPSLTSHARDVLTRVLAFVLTTGLLVLIIYYENTISPGTAFEAFMNSQGFGVRILFTSFGTVVSWFWDDYFSQIQRKDEQAVRKRMLMGRLGQSFDREVDRCCWRLDSVPTQMLQRLSSITGTSPSGMPFGRKRQRDIDEQVPVRRSALLELLLEMVAHWARAAASALGGKHDRGLYSGRDSNACSEDGGEHENGGQDEDEDEIGDEDTSSPQHSALDQAVLRFIISSIKIHKGGNIYTNPLSCFCAALGIRQQPLGYTEPHLYTGMLAAVM
ncbi:hypothetical protein V8F06_014670, partial [Rhypophila decipiens]